MTTRSSPRRPSSRPFTLGDAMILIAATAVAGPIIRLIIAQSFAPEANEDFPKLLLGLLGSGRFREFGFVMFILALPVAAAWTLALIPLRLKRPRPPWRHLARQPGWVAACSAVPGLVLLSAGVGVLRGWGRSIFYVDNIELSLFTLATSLAGATVLGSWMTLILGRRWRAEPSWLDRLGRALGVYWLAMGAGAPFLARWALG